MLPFSSSSPCITGTCPFFPFSFSFRLHSQQMLPFSLFLFFSCIPTDAPFFLCSVSFLVYSADAPQFACSFICLHSWQISPLPFPCFSFPAFPADVPRSPCCSSFRAFPGDPPFPCYPSGCFLFPCSFSLTSFYQGMRSWVIQLLLGRRGGGFDPTSLKPP